MTVQATIRTRNITVSDHQLDYIEKRIGKIDRYLPNLQQVEVDLVCNDTARQAGDRQVAQITVHVPGSILRAEEKSNDLQTAFDSALDKLQRQIERYKGKRQSAATAGAPTVRTMSPEETAEGVPQTAELTEHLVIVRRKQFALSPMSEEEALDQMVLLGHDNFFLFHNADTNKINVIYKRSDGSYGLIDTYLD